MYNNAKRIFSLITGIMSLIFGVLTILLSIGTIEFWSYYNIAAGGYLAVPELIFAAAFFMLGIFFCKRPVFKDCIRKSVSKKNILLFVLIPLFFIIIFTIGGLPILIRGERTDFVVYRIKLYLEIHSAVAFHSGLILIPNIISMFIGSESKCTVKEGEKQKADSCKDTLTYNGFKRVLEIITGIFSYLFGAVSITVFIFCLLYMSEGALLLALAIPSLVFAFSLLFMGFKLCKSPFYTKGIVNDKKYTKVALIITLILFFIFSFAAINAVIAISQNISFLDAYRMDEIPDLGVLDTVFALNAFIMFFSPVLFVINIISMLIKNKKK